MLKITFTISQFCLSAVGTLFATVALAQTLAPSPGERVFKNEKYSDSEVSVVAGLYHPWGMAF
ncbi:MAG: hypothetical protein LH481_01760, partial [Burkholderiales bacterium]|nr:hypothetical protein [Burkholderiales bacterium]